MVQAFIEPLVTEKYFQILKTRLKIQLNLLKGLRRITMEKTIYQSYLLLKIGKQLTVIAFQTIKIEP